VWERPHPSATRPARRFPSPVALVRSIVSLDLVQWPAMVVTVLAAWLVASSNEARRNWGFWTFLASNALWIVWGLHAHAYALVVLQVCLAVMNVRGTVKNDPGAASNGG
jgi:hypothetical protein